MDEVEHRVRAALIDLEDFLRWLQINWTWRNYLFYQYMNRRRNRISWQMTWQPIHINVWG